MAKVPGDSMRDDFFRAVLVVEDDPAEGSTIRQLLQKRGYYCEAAENAADALNCLSRTHFDLVISDIIMADQDGVALMREARERYPHLVFVMITGYTDLYSYADLIAAGASDYLSKPFSLSDLECRLERIRWQKWTEEELKRYRDRLETLVKERTARLELENKERQRAEEALRKSEARFRKFAEEASYEGIIFQEGGKILDINETFAKMSGYERDELIGMDMLKLVAPEYRSLVLAHSQRDYEEDYEIVACLKDGTRVPVEIHAKRIPYLGRMVRVAAVRDVSERKRNEEALQAAHQRLLDIIEFLPDATFVIDRQGIVIAWNKAMEEMSGVEKSEMLGKGDYAYAIPLYGRPRPTIADLLLGHDRDVEQSYELIERRGNTLYAEGYVPGIFGGRGGHVWGTASLLADRSGNVVGAIESMRDMTERKEMESALRHREKELEAKSLDLEETNTALKVLLKHRDADREELGASVLANVKELIYPTIEKLNNSRLDELQRTYLTILESHLREITVPFLQKLSSEFVSLSPMELHIASLIKAGKQNKEIADILGVSVNTILTHRHHLRGKLGLKNRNINLVSYLKSIGI